MRSGNRIKTLNGIPVARLTPRKLLETLQLIRPLRVECWSVQYCNIPTAENIVRLENQLLCSINAEAAAARTQNADHPGIARKVIRQRSPSRSRSPWRHLVPT